MNYIKNESGDVKVMDEKGNVKWFSMVLINDRGVMRKHTIVPNPMLEEFQDNDGADSAPAKRGRPKQNI